MQATVAQLATNALATGPRARARARTGRLGSFVSAAVPATALRITTPRMKMTDNSEMADVLLSAAMFLSSASGSTAPTESAVSTTRFTHGSALRSMPPHLKIAAGGRGEAARVVQAGVGEWGS
jgi:hypothetical protein